MSDETKEQLKARFLALVAEAGEEPSPMALPGKFDCPKLSIELVPKTAWGENLRTKLSPGKWDKIRKACYAEAGHKCEVCGGQGSKHAVEAHEEWWYDEATHTQTLTRIIALCPQCHRCKHIGRAFATGKALLAIAHLCRVNSWTAAEAGEYLNIVLAEWTARSAHAWTLNIEWLEQLDL